MTINQPERVLERIVKATSAGATREAAAAAGPIARSTMYAWIRRGRIDLLADRDTDEARFVAQLEEADNHAELNAVLAWVRHFDSDWRACRDFLERRFPQRWRRPTALEVEVRPMSTGPDISDDERAAALVEDLRRYLDSDDALEVEPVVARPSSNGDRREYDKRGWTVEP